MSELDNRPIATINGTSFPVEEVTITVDPFLRDLQTGSWPPFEGGSLLVHVKFTGEIKEMQRQICEALAFRERK